MKLHRPPPLPNNGMDAVRGPKFTMRINGLPNGGGPMEEKW